MSKTNTTASSKNEPESEDSTITSKKICFVIMPFTGTSEYEPGHFDRVYDHLIKPACIAAGYEPKRGDDSKSSNMIMLDVLRNIIECDMAICDLSSINANVFYELGIRQAFDKKTILIRDGIHPVPFDLLGFRYVPYTPSLRVDTVKKEILEIKDMLLETEKEGKLEANSIVSFLKMKPANIETKKLNVEQSIMFELLNRMKSLEKHVNISSSRNESLANKKVINKHLRSYDGVQISAYYLPMEMQAELLNKPSPNSSSFEELLDTGEALSNYIFKFQGEIIGFYAGIRGDYIQFRVNNDTTEIPNTFENRLSIKSC